MKFAWVETQWEVPGLCRVSTVNGGASGNFIAALTGGQMPIDRAFHATLAEAQKACEDVLTELAEKINQAALPEETQP